MSVLSTCINAHLNNKKIIFFGAGHYSLLTIKNIQPYIAYFCDNASSKQGSLFLGIPVNHPEVLLYEDKINTVVIINTLFFNEVAKFLYDMGFRDIYSRVYKNGDERIPESELNSSSFLQKKFEALSSYNLDMIKR